MVNGVNGTNARADMIRRFSRILASIGALVLLTASAPARADESTSTWIGLATQTCVAQAPSNRYISSLKMAPDQLQFSCRCVARDMLNVLSSREREELIRQMRQRQNLQAVGEKMFERTDVKNSALTCSAAYYLWH